LRVEVERGGLGGAHAEQALPHRLLRVALAERAVAAAPIVHDIVNSQLSTRKPRVSSTETEDHFLLSSILPRHDGPPMKEGAAPAAAAAAAVRNPVAEAGQAGTGVHVLVGGGLASLTRVASSVHLAVR
jgi:hypothetical protein